MQLFFPSMYVNKKYIFIGLTSVQYHFFPHVRIKNHLQLCKCAISFLAISFFVYSYVNKKNPLVGLQV